MSFSFAAGTSILQGHIKNNLHAIFIYSGPGVQFLHVIVGAVRVIDEDNLYNFK
jgi:hypothetical protein